MTLSHCIEKYNGPSLLHLKTQWPSAIALKNRMAFHSYIEKHNAWGHCIEK
jgi:hypothetical protein